MVKTKRGTPDVKYFVGKGKAEEIRQYVEYHKTELVLFNHDLSPAQERNLERLLKTRVLDRTGLILDIFAQRARTFEGKLQVELAQLQHLSTRLIRGWTHLERQKGGIGLRGPGETQLETDRRLISKRIDSIKMRLQKIRKQRDQSRQARTRANMLTVSLVGYTNAGKSTLFNRLTESKVYVADQLFATLDPTLRRVNVPELGTVILADTVGFIRHLPHDLVEAFSATLQETRDANLLLHVIDANDPERQSYIDAVDDVLAQIGADEVIQLQVYNKVDLLENQECRIDRNKDGIPSRVWVSAVTSQGINLLTQAIQECLTSQWLNFELVLPPEAGKLRSTLYNLGSVKSEQHRDHGGWLLTVCLSRMYFDQLIGKKYVVRWL